MKIRSNALFQANYGNETSQSEHRYDLNYHQHFNRSWFLSLNREITNTIFLITKEISVEV